MIIIIIIIIIIIRRRRRRRKQFLQTFVKNERRKIKELVSSPSMRKQHFVAINFLGE